MVNQILNKLFTDYGLNFYNREEPGHNEGFKDLVQMYHADYILLCKSDMRNGRNLEVLGLLTILLSVL